MSSGHYPNTRLRRLRYYPQLRSMIEDVRLRAEQLVMPLFIKHGTGIKNPIASMPGQFQLSIDQLEDELKDIVSLGIKSIILFGIPEHKDPLGQDAYSDSGIIQSAIPVIKKIAPQLLIIADVCFCEYTDHGHCGVINPDDIHADVDNDKTLVLLGKQAVSLVQAGADMIAPSGNQDGMVHAIRQALDSAQYQHIPILSYAVKYASSMYGPFREAAEGAPQFGDRRRYQMNFANQHEALRECALDIDEGADMLMVKPAHCYLDIITQVKNRYPSLPLAAYHTSGEFVMIKAAAQQGWLDEKRAVIEVLTAIKRAGADIIITYYAKQAAEWIKDE